MYRHDIIIMISIIIIDVIIMIWLMLNTQMCMHTALHSKNNEFWEQQYWNRLSHQNRIE